MHPRSLVNCLLCSMLSLPLAAAAQQAAPPAGSESKAQREMMQRVASATALGPQQQALTQYLGHWAVDIELPGQHVHSTGTADYSWVIPGRWLGCRISGAILGQPFEEFTILGYDSFARSLVEVSVESADNSMLMSRGSPQPPAGGPSVLYGELDEYNSGSLHRPYKVVMQWLSPTRHVTQVWDLGTGEHPVEKISFTFTRPN